MGHRLSEAGILGLLLVVAAVLIMWAGRATSFRGDEWGWIFGGLHVTPDTIIGDDNGHLNALTLGVFNVLAPTVGLAHYWIYRVVALVLHLIVVALVFCVAHRSIGPRPALAAAAVIAFLGTGADAFLSAINLGASGSIAACLGALLMLSRRTRRADVVACALLTVGLASWSVAVAFTAGVFAEVLWQPDRWRRIWVPLIPTVLYTLWRLHWAHSLTGDAGNGAGASQGPGAVLRHGWEAASGALAGLGGVQLASPSLKAHLPWLHALAEVGVALAAGLLIWRLVQRRSIDARFLNVLVAGVAFWLLLGAERGSRGDVTDSRYIYQGAVIGALIVVEAMSGQRVSPRAARILAFGAIVAVALNIAWMVSWGNFLRREATVARAQLAALDIARDRVPASFRPSDGFTLHDVSAASYFAAARRFGSSPAYTTAQLRRSSLPARRAADLVLVRALAFGLVPGRLPVGGPPPTLANPAFGGSTATHGSCLSLTPRAVLATAAIEPGSPAGVVFESRPGASVTVQARRFGDRYVTLLASGPSGTLTTPLGTAGDPWHLQVISTGPTRICSISSLP